MVELTVPGGLRINIGTARLTEGRTAQLARQEGRDSGSGGEHQCDFASNGTTLHEQSQKSSYCSGRLCVDQKVLPTLMACV